MKNHKNGGSCVLAGPHQVQEGSVNVCLEIQEQKS
jgi:hypothetical protein